MMHVLFKSINQLSYLFFSLPTVGESRYRQKPHVWTKQSQIFIVLQTRIHSSPSSATGVFIDEKVRLIQSEFISPPGVVTHKQHPAMYRSEA